MTEPQTKQDLWNAAITSAIKDIEALDQHRAEITAMRQSRIAALATTYKLNKRAISTFLARRKLADQDRESWDASLDSLRALVNPGGQGDLLDDPLIDAEYHDGPTSSGTH